MLGKENDRLNSFNIGTVDAGNPEERVVIAKVAKKIEYSRRTCTCTGTTAYIVPVPECELL